jgi:hypothetical protein
MSDELAKMIEDYATLNNISKAAAISVLCSQSLTQNKAFSMLPDLMAAIKKEQEKQEKQENQNKLHG